MPTLGLAHYNLRADSALLITLRDFYVAAVGLEIGPRAPLSHHGFWLNAGGRDVLHLSEERPEDKRRSGADLTFDHVAFDCTNSLEAKARLAKLAINFVEKRVPGSGKLQLFFRDPAGNGIELLFPADEP